MSMDASEPTRDAVAGGAPTAGSDYAERLERLSNAWWKRWLNVQAPYRWNIRRLKPGRTLDIGCGIGRYLAHLDTDAVGVDHNAQSIAIARSQGFTAYTVDGFLASDDARAESFDTVLFSHVMEHMDRETDDALVAEYLQYLRPGGKVIFMTPEERGYASDATHVQFVDWGGLRSIAEAAGLEVRRWYSFPFPRAVGRYFTHNEFVLVAEKPAATA